MVADREGLRSVLQIGGLQLSMAPIGFLWYCRALNAATRNYHPHVSARLEEDEG